MLGEKIREYGFWFADALRGGQVRRYYRNLKQHMENTPTPPDLDLQMLLKHATGTTDFYRPFIGCSGIGEFPLVTKTMIKKNAERFVSSAYRGKSLHTMRTSGSTGERFAVLQNREKRNRVLAELIYFNDVCGFHLGERYLYSRVWFKDNRKSIAVRLAENMLPFNCSSLSDASLDDLCRLLQKDPSIKLLRGYASSLEVIADYVDRQGYAPELFHLNLIVSGAERLDSSAKTKLKKAFGCPVVSRYSNQENGVLAQQDVEGDWFHLNTAHYYFEWLQLDCDIPASFGEPARLVLTDLYNWAMPMIRYDTGDVVIAGQREGKAEKIILLDVSGRCDEVISDTRGNKISPHAVALHFRAINQISQYQLVQNSPTDFVLKLESARGIYDDASLKRSLYGLVGADAAVEIIHLDAIPPAASGKRKKVIRNY